MIRIVWVASLSVSIALLVVGVSAVRADYIINDRSVDVVRLSDSGGPSGVPGYLPPAAILQTVETYGEGYAVTPDLKTLYVFSNSLGLSEGFAFDVMTGQYLPGKLLNPPIPYHNGQPDYDAAFHPPGMALIRSADPFALGDFFGINYLQAIGGQVIKRIDRTTNALTETILPPTPQPIYDFGFGPDNRLYMAAQNGVFVYTESAAGFTLTSSTPLLGAVTGTMTFGPDGKLYMRNSVTGNIDRYTPGGQFIDTFIPASAIPESHPTTYSSIQFGADGNFHIEINYGGINFGQLATGIGKYNGLTGAPISVINWYAQDYFGPVGRITYVPAPEPSTLLLAICGGLPLMMKRRGR